MKSAGLTIFGHSGGSLTSGRNRGWSGYPRAIMPATSPSADARAHTRAPIDFPAAKIGSPGHSFRANRTAPSRSSPSAVSFQEAFDFASTYRKLNRRAQTSADAAASATRRTNGFRMSFDRPWAITRPAFAGSTAWTMPWTSPVPEAFGNRTSVTSLTANLPETPNRLVGASRHALNASG